MKYVFLSVALALAGAAMADSVVESAREIPVASDVDVVVVGGTAHVLRGFRPCVAGLRSRL